MTSPEFIFSSWVNIDHRGLSKLSIVFAVIDSAINCGILLINCMSLNLGNSKKVLLTL